ncbi:MAG: hypothetical protein L7S47_06495 [Acidimicrobiales bacterium]|jgi:predicted component of type VI protein secretion system|nr:hypothetical protein [Acidimicrobiales bacterium]|tara:strand:+ start:302 stop:730 length:429 start_codon:yes stop_codon:yes gene_type:complete
MMTEHTVSLLGELLTGANKDVSLFDDITNNLNHIFKNLPTLIDTQSESDVISESMLNFGNIPVNYHGNRELLVARLQETIGRFEPRLEEVSVQIFGAQQNGAVLRLGLTAKANINGYWTDVFFGANLEQNGTWAKLTDSELG